MTLVSKAFSDIITFSRSSNATRIGPTGLVEYAPHNLLLQSQTFDNASWTLVNAIITADAVAAPNGNITGDKVSETAVTGAFIVYEFVMPSGGTYTFSVYAKAAERTKFALEFSSATPVAIFDLSAGTVSSTTDSTATITSVGNGWYRCSMTATLAAVSTSAISIRDASGNRSYAGTAGSGIYLWGAQLSVGPYPLDYTPTTSAAVYGPRFDYDPVTLAARGLLVEEQRTNLVTWSDDFSNGSWIKGLATISANSGTAPDGTQTADKLIPTAVSSADHGVYQITAASGVGVYTVSAFVKAAGYNFADIFDGYGSALITVDLTNGSYSVVGSPTATSVTAFGNGWYRVTITRTVSGVPAYIQIRAQNDINRTAFTGDGTSGIYVWGAQSEQASFATSYIPTIGTVTRSADVASVNTLSPWFNATEGTFFAEFDLLAASSVLAASASPRVFSAHAGSTLTAMDELIETNGAAFFGIDSGSGQWTISRTPAIAAATTAKFAGAFKVNDIAAVLNNGSVGTDTSATIPSVTTLQLADRYGSDRSLNGHLRRIAYYPRRLQNAELQALTA